MVGVGMIRSSALAAAMGVFSIVTPTRAQVYLDQCDDWQGKRFSVDERIDGCTSQIHSGKYSGEKLARAYNNRGIAWYDKGEKDRAIADYTEALRIDPTNAVAYNNRGNAWKLKGETDRAIADYTEATQFDSRRAETYYNRGLTWYDKGDKDRAIADCTEAIRLDPRYAVAYTARGIAKLFTGSLPEALADIRQGSVLDPKDAYAALWLDILNRRSSLPSQLAQSAKQLDMTKWPGPVLRVYLGELKPEEVLAEAADAESTSKTSRACEANFYLAELALLGEAKDEATRLFRVA